MSTFDRDAAELARDEAIERVDRHAEDLFKVCAPEALRYVAARRNELTTDAVWYVLDRRFGVRPHEERAMGPIMLAAQRKGWIEATNRTVKSARVECHARPLRIWRSLIVGQD